LSKHRPRWSLVLRFSNSEQLTWINEQYKPLLIKAFAFQKGEVIFLALLKVEGKFSRLGGH